MSNPLPVDSKWIESGTDSATAFQQFIQRSADPIWLFDPAAGVFIDCNQAAVDLMGCGTKEYLLQRRPEDISPERQADGSSSRERITELHELVQRKGTLRFEWLARRFDGAEVLLEVLSTAVQIEGLTRH